MLFKETIAFNNFNLPIVLEQDCLYYDSLKHTLENYLTEVAFIQNLPLSVVVNTFNNIKLILDSVEHYYNADITAASQKINTILQRYQNSSFFVSNANSSYAFKGIIPFNLNPNLYRARKGNLEFQLNDFLHIPLDARGKIATQRFSIPGVPCLYLGTTSYVCWLELDKPIDNELNISAFEIPNIKILNLALTQQLINGHSNQLETIDPNDSDVQKLFHMIELWPLVCSTSYRIKEENRVFKSEYIISNLIMQNLTDFQIEGVAYISKKIKNDSNSFPQAVNLAIPIKSSPSPQSYGDVCRYISLSTPVNFGEFVKIEHLLTYPFTSLVNRFEGYSSLIEFAGNRIIYQKLPFSKFDDYLLSLNFHTPNF